MVRIYAVYTDYAAGSVPKPDQRCARQNGTRLVSSSPTSADETDVKVVRPVWKSLCVARMQQLPARRYEQTSLIQLSDEYIGLQAISGLSRRSVHKSDLTVSRVF